MRSISTRAPLVLMAAGSMILLGGGVASACVTAHPGADQSPAVSKTDKPGDQTQGDKTQGDKTQGDKVVTDKTQGDKTQGDKVVTDKTDKPAVKKIPDVFSSFISPRFGILASNLVKYEEGRNHDEREEGQLRAGRRRGFDRRI